MNKSIIGTVWKERVGGGGKTARRYLDILIDGKSLLDHLGRADDDSISRLGWLSDAYNNEGIEQLLLHRSPDSPSGRVILLVCPECADLGCGAYTARISTDDSAFVWADFAFENNYEEAPVAVYPDVGPFHFSKQQYINVLSCLKK